MKFTIYSTTTGEILRWGRSNVAQPLNPGEGVIEGQALTSHRHRVDLTKEQPVIVEKAPEVAPPVDKKRALLDRLAERRWEVETGGLQLNGMSVATDDRSKLLLFAAAEKARLNADFTTKWKTESGWVPLDAAAILAVRDAVFAHVATCFAREEELAAAVEQASEADLPSIAQSIEVFWPPIAD